MKYSGLAALLATAGPPPPGHPLVDALQRVGEARDVGDPLLEEVAGALGRLFQQPRGVARVEVVGEDEHRCRVREIGPMPRETPDRDVAKKVARNSTPADQAP
jgi:hypothetical protein